MKNVGLPQSVSLGKGFPRSVLKHAEASSSRLPSIIVKWGVKATMTSFNREWETVGARGVPCMLDVPSRIESWCAFGILRSRPGA